VDRYHREGHRTVEPCSDSVGQVGLLGDESGTIKFTKWAKSDLAELEEGTVYDLGNVVTDEYEGRYSVKLNSTTTIEERDEDLEVGNDDTTVEGRSWTSSPGAASSSVARRRTARASSRTAAAASTAKVRGVRPPHQGRARRRRRSHGDHLRPGRHRGTDRHHPRGGQGDGDGRPRHRGRRRRDERGDTGLLLPRHRADVRPLRPGQRAGAPDRPGRR